MIIVIGVVVFLLCLGGYFLKICWYDTTHSVDILEQAEDENKQAEDDNKPKYEDSNKIDLKTSLRYDPSKNIDNNPYLKAGVVAS